MRMVWIMLPLIFLMGVTNAHDLSDNPSNCTDKDGNTILNFTEGCDENTPIHDLSRYVTACGPDSMTYRKRDDACKTFDTLKNHRVCEDCIADGSSGWGNIDLTGVVADNSVFNGPGQQWTNVIWENASLSNTNFGGGTFYKGTTFKNADLQGANFQGTKWDAVINFTQADLTDANFSSSYFIQVPNFNDAKTLKGANFRNVVVNWKTFQILRNKGADLEGIKLRESTSVSVKNGGWVYDETQPLQFQNMALSDLKDLDLTGVDIDGANFKNINLVDLNIIFSNTAAGNVIFIGATLGQSHFNDLTRNQKKGVVLDESILKELELKGGKLISYKGAQISNSKIISGLNSFIYDDETTMENVTIASGGKINPLLFSKIVNSNKNPVTYKNLIFEEGSVISDIFFGESLESNQLNFENVNFFHVTLERVNFQKASFYKSKLMCSIFNEVDLTDAKLEKTPLKYIRWCDTKDVSGNSRTGQCGESMPTTSSQCN